MVNAQEVIARALALSEAATDGPWEITVDASRTGVEHSVWSEVASGYAAEFIPDMPDAEFIAAARTLLPALAKALGDVLDLHVGRPNSVSAMYPVPLCSCGEEYPTCPTRGAVTAALSEVTQ